MENPTETRRERWKRLTGLLPPEERVPEGFQPAELPSKLRENAPVASWLTEDDVLGDTEHPDSAEVCDEHDEYEEAFFDYAKPEVDDVVQTYEDSLDDAA